MTYNPFTGKGDFQTPKDTPYKKAKRSLTEKQYRQLIARTKTSVYRLRKTG